MRICLTIFLFSLICFKALAQKPDTTRSQAGTDSLKQVPAHATLKPFKKQKSIIRVAGPDSTHSPHKAVMRSLMIPGWGQLYNREWYYVPLIYGGLASFSYYMVYNLNDYHKYLNEARFREAGGTHDLNGTDEFKNVSGGAQQFYDVAAGAQRNFQICILGIVGVWGINCVEAYIGAKFIHSYTIDNNLSFKVSPSLLNQPTLAFNNYSYIPGIKLTLAVK